MASLSVFLAVLVALLGVLIIVFPQSLSFSLAFLEKMFHQEAKQRTVIVVGGGLAGMSAALEAAQNGASVILLDKEKAIGGNSAKASSGINAAPTPAQAAKGISDSVELLREDTIKSGGGLSDPDLVNILVNSSSDAISFLTSFGVNLEEITICGGHSVARTHRSKAPAKGNIGFIITSTLKAKIEASPTIQVRVNARLTSLLVTEDGRRVRGVQYTNVTDNSVVSLDADAVVLATGGFAADKSGLLSQHAPSTASLPTTNGPFATGDGVKIAARDVHASLSLMDQVQVHPTGLLDPKQPSAGTVFLGAEALRGSGGILVDAQGRRFVNELGYRSKVTEAILHHGFPFTATGPTVSYLLLNDEAVNLFQASAYGFYVAKGLATKFDSASEFAAQKNLPQLSSTLSAYNEAKSKGKDEFGKTVFPVAFDEKQPLYVMYVTPAIHYTMGGVKINPQTQVLSSSNAIIGGLYAAGEVTAGVHGENRLAGNSLLECVVFGRRAGKAASGASL